MIQSDFYPTLSTYGEIQLTDTVTSLIGSITDIDETFLDPYMMGYILRENMPSLYKPFKPEYDSTTETFVFKPFEVSNIAWGFGVFVNSYQQENYVFPHITGRYENDVWTYNTGASEHGYGGNITLPNNIFYHKQNSSDVVVLVFTTFEMGTNNQVYGIYHGRKVMLLSEYIDFINGESKLELPTQRGTYEFEYNTIGNMIYNEIEDDPYVKGEYAMFYGLSQTSRQTYSGVSSGVSIQPIFKYKLLTDDGDIPYFTANANSLSSNINFDYAAIQITTDNNSISNYSMVRSGDYYLGNADFSISKSEIPASQGSYWVINDYKALGLRNGPYQVLIFICVPPEDLLPYFNIFNKIKKSSTIETPIATTTYTTDDFVCLYTSSDVPKNERISGNYNDISNQLRPWQLYNIPNTANNFDVKDIPEPTPPEESDDNTESGDKVPNQFGRTVGVTSNFITNYLMTEGQISKLGEVLWTSWADDAVTMDMVNNFYGKFHDATGSWNVSDALQFIVSCRLFPCSLATLVSTTQVSSIPIGTGAFALQCGTSSEPNFFIANEATAILNCGDIYIPKEYNDYRDFENTKITAYLPFCGSVELNPQDVVGKWLGCTYAIDLFDGSCKAFIYTLSGNDVGYEGAYYNVAIKQGQCGFLIPMSGTQAGQVASRQKVDGYTDGALLYQAAAGLMESAMALGGYSDANPVAGFNKMITAGTASSVLTAQRLGRAGISAPTTSGGSGFTDFHQPASAYVQIRRSYYQEPLQYEHSIGFPTNGAVYDNLSQFSGFIKCVNVDLSGFTCHEDERSEIKALLESGVYL